MIKIRLRRSTATPSVYIWRINMQTRGGIAERNGKWTQSFTSFFLCMTRRGPRTGPVCIFKGRVAEPHDRRAVDNRWNLYRKKHEGKRKIDWEKLAGVGYWERDACLKYDIIHITPTTPTLKINNYNLRKPPFFLLLNLTLHVTSDEQKNWRVIGRPAVQNIHTLQPQEFVAASTTLRW